MQNFLSLIDNLKKKNWKNSLKRSKLRERVLIKENIYNINTKDKRDMSCVFSFVVFQQT